MKNIDYDKAREKVDEIMKNYTALAKNMHEKCGLSIEYVVGMEVGISIAVGQVRWMLNDMERSYN